MKWRAKAPPTEGAERTALRFAWWPLRLDDGRWCWLERVVVRKVYATKWWLRDQERLRSAPHMPPDTGVEMDDCEKWRRLSVVPAGEAKAALAALTDHPGGTDNG